MALGHPQISDDPETRALTLTALAETYELLGDARSAATRWTEAIQTYEALGDGQLAATLTQRLDRISEN